MILTDHQASENKHNEHYNEKQKMKVMQQP